MLNFTLHYIYAHLIGDYILQNDWMASNKKKYSLVCLIHVVTYLIPFLFTELSAIQLLLIGIQHFIQDRTNLVVWFMKAKGSKEFTKPPMAPWGIFITDNIIHLLFIQLIINFL